MMHVCLDKIWVSFWISVPLFPLNVFLCYPLQWQPFAYWNLSVVDHIIVHIYLSFPHKRTVWLYSSMPLSFITGRVCILTLASWHCTWPCSLFWPMWTICQGEVLNLIVFMLLCPLSLRRACARKGSLWLGPGMWSRSELHQGRSHSR